MILIDFSQMCIGSIMLQTGGKAQPLNEGPVRAMILNSLRNIILSFKKEYGTPVICCDSRHYWRRDVFPHYKAHRKADQVKTGYDWDMIHALIDQFKTELKEFFPYPVLEVEGTEADDIIGILSISHWEQENKILVVSTDKDFMQLQRYPNVRQYNAITGKFLTCENPKEFLHEHILRGDPGDGIPNVLSPEATMVAGVRQKPLNKRKLAQMLDEWDSMGSSAYAGRFLLNQQLVDFRKIPVEFYNEVLTAYDTYKAPSMQTFRTYLGAMKMTDLLGVVGDFNG